MGLYHLIIGLLVASDDSSYIDGHELAVDGGINQI